MMPILFSLHIMLATARPKTETASQDRDQDMKNCLQTTSRQDTTSIF